MWNAVTLPHCTSISRSAARNSFCEGADAKIAAACPRAVIAACSRSANRAAAAAPACALVSKTNASSFSR